METASPIITHPKKTLQTEETRGWFRWKLHVRTFAEFLAKYYVIILIALGTYILLLETTEHFRSIDDDTSLYISRVVPIVLLLGLTGFLTRMLLVSLAERSRANNILRLKHELGMHLSASRDIPELAGRIVQQIASIVPTMDIKLYTYAKKESQFVPAANLSASKPGQGEVGSPPRIDPSLCQHCLAQKPMRLRSLRACRQMECFQRSQFGPGYCLPLAQGALPAGLLILYSRTQNDLTAMEIEFLEHVTPEIAGSLNAAIEKQAREDELLTQKVRAVQMEIARDLHDTIGQNISYLRMKLDHLSETHHKARVTIGDIRQMCQVANESYDSLRGTLDVLLSGSLSDLQRLFSRYAEMVAERSALQVDITNHGMPKSLSPTITRQLFLVFREVFNNVEKHASASQVHVEISWKEAILGLTITDNGCGFDTTQLLEKGHYGIKFMQERIAGLNGNFSIDSQVGAGTKIRFNLPYG